MWMEIGWALYFQVVGTHKHYMWSSKFFLPQMVGTLKPSIEMLSLPLTPFTPCLLPLLHVCSLHSPSLPFAPLTPLILHWPCPQVVGTIQPSIEIPPIGPHLLPFTKILGPRWGLQCPFAPMWMEIGWALYFQVVGTHKHYMWSSKFFPPQMVGTLKLSIEMLLLPLLPFTPFAPLCSLRSPWREWGCEGTKLGGSDGGRQQVWEVWKEWGCEDTMFGGSDGGRQWGCKGTKLGGSDGGRPQVRVV